MEVTGESKEKVLKVLCALVFVGLILLRFPLLILPKFFNLNISSQTSSLVFEDGTYLLTALMILLLKDNLAKYKFNLLAIIVFLLAPIIKAVFYSTVAKNLPVGDLEFSKFQVVVSIVLCVLLIVSHAKVHKENWIYYVKWIVVALVVGVLVGSAIGLVYSHYQSKSMIPPTFLLLVFAFLTQLSNAAALEEPLFRGFLWGFLEGKGWKQVWVWLFQAALFCSAHAYYLPQSPVFFVGTFVTGLILGLLVWLSKSVGTSMIAHGLINSVADIVMHYIL